MEGKQQVPKRFSRCKEWPFLGSLDANVKPSPLLLSASQEQISGTQPEKPEKPEASWPRVTSSFHSISYNTKIAPDSKIPKTM